MLSKQDAYQMILNKSFGIREERNIESKDVYVSIYDKLAVDKKVIVRTMVLSEDDAACWISAAIRYDVRRMIAINHIKKESYMMDRLAELEAIATELEKDYV